MAVCVCDKDEKKCSFIFTRLIDVVREFGSVKGTAVLLSVGAELNTMQ